MLGPVASRQIVLLPQVRFLVVPVVRVMESGDTQVQVEAAVPVQTVQEKMGGPQPVIIHFLVVVAMVGVPLQRG
jgi:hypothetical protein